MTAGSISCPSRSGRGKEVGAYFARYERETVLARVARVEGQLALAIFAPGAPTPSYFILLELAAGRVQAIRDFRYVPYIALEAELELLD